MMDGKLKLKTFEADSLSEIEGKVNFFIDKLDKEDIVDFKIQHVVKPTGFDGPRYNKFKEFYIATLLYFGN